MQKWLEFENDGSLVNVVKYTTEDKYTGGQLLGALEYDDEQQAFIFWQANENEQLTDNGVTYFDSLKETEETLKDELLN